MVEGVGCHKEPGSVGEYGEALFWLTAVSLIAVFLCADQYSTSAFFQVYEKNYAVQVQLLL